MIIVMLLNVGGGLRNCKGMGMNMVKVVVSMVVNNVN